MLYLPHHSSEKIEEYYKFIRGKIKNEIGLSSLDRSVKDYLSDTRIKDIIFCKPQKLLRFHHDLMPKLFVGASLKDYNAYCRIKKKAMAHRVGNEDVIFNTYHPHYVQLQNVFNYDRFISHSQAASYGLSKILNQNTCSYCNRLYTTTVIVSDPITQRVNNSSRITRPTFDHWYSKSKYPILALSFYNLIPSCSVCNTSVKRDTEFSLNRHIHPYKKERGQDFKFNYIYESVHENNITLTFPNNSKIGKTLKDLRIKDIYNGHSEYELKDLLELRYKYSVNYLDTLFNKTFDINIGKIEVYRLIFGVESKEIHYHKRPFSKFKKDILEQLGIKI